jgi:putative ABC transport system permease protein
VTGVLERPSPARSGPRGGGAPARRAVARWSWRLFRREWRQHVLVLVLLTVAVAGTVAGLAVATNTQAPAATTFTLPGADPHLASDLAAFRHLSRDADIQLHRQVRVRGLANPVDLRAQMTPGAPTATLRLVAGHMPTGADEVAMTRGLAELLGLHLASTWNVDGHDRRVVGLVENPTDLNDGFALVAPGKAEPPDRVTVRMPSSGRVDSFRLRSGTSLDIQTLSPSARTGAAVGVLVIATLGMLFVGLMAVAGFTVMAHRRLRALGMLASVGATTRHVRLVMLVDGLAVGITASVVGAAIGLAAWMVFALDLETIAAHRIDRFALPWGSIGVAMLLAVVTAVAAAWWPARSVARIPVVAALSGRPPRPQPPRRLAVVGVVTAMAGLGLLAAAGERNLLCIAVGIPLTVIGVLLLAPVTLAAVARLGGQLPLAPRLAVRDLARHQTRSGAALGAVTLALGLAAVIAITATDAQARAASELGNLPANELVVYLSPYGFGGPVAPASTAQQAAAERQVHAIASAVGARDVIPLAVASSIGGPDALPPGTGGPNGPPPASLVRVSRRGHGIEEDLIAPLYVATPRVLTAYGIDPERIGKATDVLTSYPDPSGLKLDPDAAVGETLTPVIQRAPLPRHGSEPNSLITMTAVRRSHLQVQTAAWLIRAPHPITAAQRASAEHLAHAADLPVESRQQQASLNQLRTDATVAGVLLALGVLAMTVGLVRSEAANDLRTLTATGASSTTRRSLTAATAGLLALLGSVSGIAAAYLALTVWYHRNLQHVTHVPVIELLVILVGLPLVATIGGWLLAGRPPSAIARRPLD